MRPELTLRPTPEQYDAFASYLPNAHSWYKHLPLLQGRQFVVFVAPDVAVGRRVAKLNHPDPSKATDCVLLEPEEGPEFTEEHPRLHYGWKTTKEYRQRFGNLDYMHRSSPSESYARDAGPVMKLPESLEQRCSFILYPYVAGQFVEAVTYDLHAEAIEQLRKGAPHPGREEVVEMARLANEQRAVWNQLSRQEEELVLALTLNKPTDQPVSNAVRECVELGNRVGAVQSSLYSKEKQKIRRALAELDDWLLEHVE
jgi:hypothetical protein